VSSTTAPQVVTFEATDDTAGLILDQDHVDVTFVVGPTDALNSTVTADPLTVVADGAATSTITVTLKDAQGNPVEGHDVCLANLNGTNVVISPTCGSSDANGLVVFDVSSTDAQQDVTFFAVDTTLATILDQAAQVHFTWGRLTSDVHGCSRRHQHLQHVCRGRPGLGRRR